MTVHVKACTKCGAVKPSDEFGKDAQKSDGLQSCCRVCHNAAGLAYRVANRDKEKARKAKWRAENLEKVVARSTAYYAANLDKEKSRKDAWRASNPEAYRLYAHTRRARKRNSSGVLSSGISEKLFVCQRGRCACGCQQPLGDDFHLDHRMPLALGGSNTDDNMQLLRKGCNLRKGAKHPIEFMQKQGYLI